MRSTVLFLCISLFSFVSLAAPASTKKVPSTIAFPALTDKEIADDFVGHLSIMTFKIWDLMAESYEISLSVYKAADETIRVEMRKRREAIYASAASVITDKPRALHGHEGHKFKNQTTEQKRVNASFIEFSLVVEALNHRLDDLKIGYDVIDRRALEGYENEACECDEDEDAPCDHGEPCGPDGGVSVPIPLCPELPVKAI